MAAVTRPAASSPTPVPASPAPRRVVLMERPKKAGGLLAAVTDAVPRDGEAEAGGSSRVPLGSSEMTCRGSRGRRALAARAAPVRLGKHDRGLHRRLRLGRPSEIALGTTPLGRSAPLRPSKRRRDDMTRYTLNVPVEYTTRDGGKKTSYRRVGAVSRTPGRVRPAHARPSSPSSSTSQWAPPSSWPSRPGPAMRRRATSPSDPPLGIRGGLRAAPHRPSRGDRRAGARCRRGEPRQGGPYGDRGRARGARHSPARHGPQAAPASPGALHAPGRAEPSLAARLSRIVEVRFEPRVPNAAGRLNGRFGEDAAIRTVIWPRGPRTAIEPPCAATTAFPGCCTS